jgi:Domain of unknown function (DUF4424)
MKKVVVALLLAAIANPVRANDSAAELATGGIVLVRNDHIEMRSEDLYISAAEIRVKYRFYNKSASDVTVHVAFPMPEVRVEHQDQNISLPTEDPVNLLGFVTKVNGQPVAMQVEQRVFAGGVERTAMLRGLGVPLAPHLQATNRALDRLPRDKRDELVRLGLAEVDEADFGKGLEQHLSARWGLQTTFYWQQSFPARKETVIEHRYKPSVGGMAITPLGSDFGRGDPELAAIVSKYCVERDLIGALERARRTARNAPVAPFSEERIEYVLKTGANWSGPIKDFRLVVDKGRPENLVSFCGDGVKKIGPTQFEMRKKDFTPDSNFAVLILKRLRQQTSKHGG